MGCKFCASTIGGKERSIAMEMLDRDLWIQALSGERVSNGSNGDGRALR